MRFVFGALLVSLSLCVEFSPSQTTPKELKTGPVTVGGKTMSQWKLDLSDPDPSRRAHAIVAIAGFGDSNAECVPTLIKITHDNDVSPRVRAVIALRMVAVDDKDLGKVINALAARLDTAKEGQAIVRLEAVVSLKRFVGESALNSALPNLMKGTLDKGSWEIRHHCVSTIWRIGTVQKTGTDPLIYEALLAVLKTENTQMVRVEALQGLAALGRPTTPPLLLNKIVIALTAFAHSKNESYSIWAHTALVAMQEGTLAEKSLLSIGKLLSNKNPKSRIEAANALGSIGPRAKSRVAMLVAMLGDTDTDAIWAACYALGNIGEANDTVVDPLVKLLADKDPSRAAAAVTALMKLHVNTVRVTGTLEKMRETKDLDIKLRGYVERAVVEIKKPKK